MADPHKEFTTRTANAVTEEIRLAVYFKSLDGLRSFVRNDPRALTLLGRIPGLGGKGVLEIYRWATGNEELPRSEGSIRREKQREAARSDRAETLRRQIARAKENIAIWEVQLADLGK